jgi:predicted Zn-dependent peptidase
MTSWLRCDRSQLDCGLPLVVIEMPHLHSVSVVMYARVGSRYENARDNGLSHFLEHMLFRGTRSMPNPFDVNRTIEGLGATLYAETGRDYSLYQISLPPSSLDEGLEIFGEIFTSPAFSDIDVERRIVLEEMREDLSDDGRFVNIDDLARRSVWPRHPLGFRITGPASNVRRFSRADVQRHFGKFYGANNMLLAVAGAVPVRKVAARVRRAFAGLSRGRAADVVSPPVDKRRQARLITVEEEASQTKVQILFTAFGETDPRYPALLVLGRVLDDGMSTRLHRRLLDELGLAYYVSGGIEPFIDAGLVEIDASCAPHNAARLTREALVLCRDFAERDVSAEELAKAKRRYRWDLERSLDDPDAAAGWLAGSTLFLPPLSLDEKIARIERVDAAAIRAVARDVFRPEHLTVAAVGPGLESGPRRHALEKLVVR